MTIAANTYAPLWCKSNYSFLEGASHPDELVDEAHRLGLRSLALTDRDGVYGVVRAYRKAQELGVHLIIGAEMTLFDESKVVLLAENRAGYANLCRLISKGRLRSPKGESHVGWDEVCAHADGLVALWGGASSLIVNGSDADVDGVATDLRNTFGDRVYALLARHREPEDADREHRLRERAARHHLPTVAAMEVLYHTPARRELQDVLTCIRHGVSLPTAGRLTRSNAEHALRAPYGFALLYEDDLASLRRTEEVAERCRFSLSELRYRYPGEKLPDGMTSAAWLRELTYRGAKERYPEGVPANVAEQIDKELGLVCELEYDGYFLTMWEIVRYCREHDILCQGRGSAANSVVCYCLGITAVDPVRMGLLFERFISKERAEAPDIDLDIEHDRREEVIQHVYARYGRTHAAMVANVIRYRAKSAVREVGKALGLSETAVERVARLLHFDALNSGAFEKAGFDGRNQFQQNLWRLTQEIQDFPRHLSIHPGGFLLGHEPVGDLVPIENATMPDRTVIQWDKEDLEDLGLFKVDLLGLGALNVVHRAFNFIKQHYDEEWTLATIPPQDEPTFEMIRAADTVGTFQIESRAQMAMLPRLRPREYYDLVIQVSLVRPGPITGGMVHPYLRRRAGEEEVTYPHPVLEPILKRTLGVPLFQEQVMQLAIVAADYTPGEADQLRRDMSAWRNVGRIERHRERLIERMKRKGIAQEFAERVFEQIRGFGEYGFPESHAASFALIAYATSWLKCHYPEAFLAAMLNAQPMGFYSAATLVEDGKRHDLEIRPIDVQCSDWDCTLEPIRSDSTSHFLPPSHSERSEESQTSMDAMTQAQILRSAQNDGRGGNDTGNGNYNQIFAVRMGLRYVKGLHKTAGERIVAARKNAPFTSLEDIAVRARLEDGILVRLAESGALEAFESQRRDALWSALATDSDTRPRLAMEDAEPYTAFQALDNFETIGWDYDFTGHSPRGHPLGPLREELTRQKLPDAETIRGYPNGRRVRYAGLVICRQRPGTAKGVFFMTLEDETGFVNVVVWEKVFAKYEVLAKTVPFVGITGKLQVESGVVHLVAEEFWTPDVKSQRPATKSRDFH